MIETEYFRHAKQHRASPASEGKDKKIMEAVEKKLLGAITLDAPWDLVETFSGMHRWRPEDVNVAADLIADRLKSLGIPFQMHEPTVFLSIPIDASVEMDGEVFRAKPPSNSLSAPDGVTGPLVYVSANKKALRSYSRDVAELFGGAIQSVEQAKELVAGKIVITEGFGNPALTSLVEEWGGIGLISVNPGIDIHWGTCTTVWGTPDLDDLPRRPRIPALSVNNPDGLRLIERAKADGSITIKTVMEEGWYPQKIPTVHIPASGHLTDEADKFVFAHGHYDSWEVGVGDNATGDATLLELARVFWNNRDQLNRSVRIAWWPGHSTGRYAGSTWYADAFAIDLDENCVAQVNCDSPGCRWATSYHQTTTMPEVSAHVTRAIQDVTGQPVATKRPNQAGDYAFNNIGITSYFMLSSTMPADLRAEKGYYDVSGCGGNIAWHTENDILEIADKDVLMTDMKIYLLSVLRNANAKYLPYDWRAATDEFLSTIDKYQEAAGELYDLTAAKDATTDLATSLGMLQQQIDSGQIEPLQANALLQNLARILVPINFTRDPRFTHDPAYTTPPLPTLATASEISQMPSDLRGFAETQLLRGQNRYVAALRGAKRLVDAEVASVDYASAAD